MVKGWGFEGEQRCNAQALLAIGLVWNGEWKEKQDGMRLDGLVRSSAIPVATSYHLMFSRTLGWIAVLAWKPVALFMCYFLFPLSKYLFRLCCWKG